MRSRNQQTAIVGAEVQRGIDGPPRAAVTAPLLLPPRVPPRRASPIASECPRDRCPCGRPCRSRHRGGGVILVGHSPAFPARSASRRRRPSQSCFNVAMNLWQARWTCQRLTGASANSRPTIAQAEKPSASVFRHSRDRNAVPKQPASQTRLRPSARLQAGGDASRATLERALLDITQNSLRVALRDLERDGMMTRSATLTIPPRDDHELIPWPLDA